MKKLLVIALTFAATTTFAAEEVNPAHELCKAVSNLAEAVMEGRQAGFSVVTQMEIVGTDSLRQAIVTNAYENPRYNSKEYQRQSISDFRDDWYIRCRQQIR